MEAKYSYENCGLTAVYNVKLSAISFLFSLNAFIWTYVDPCWDNGCVLGRHCLVLFIIIIFGKLMFENRQFEVLWRASVIGITFSIGLHFLLRSDIYCSFATYLCALSFFHISEYAVTGLTNPSNLSTDSFLLNHSVQYWLAAFASWIEYSLELYFFPSQKNCFIIYGTGFLLIILGEVIRKMAMFHAGRSFSHIVQNTKKSDHELVKSGIFTACRHPSYVGWMMWSIGTQILLANPFCLLAYTYVTWAFFNERIYIEEYTLIQFFGDEYTQYQEKVPVGIPFIKGYMHSTN